MSKRTRKILIGIVVAVVAILVLIGLYNIPFIHEKLAWRIEDLQTQLYYFFNPPEEVTFVPAEGTRMTLAPSLTRTSTLEVTVETSQTSTITTTALPGTVILDNVTFIDQMNRWNYCGPANLAMALTYLGWEGEPGSTLAIRDQIGTAIKPGPEDSSLDFIQRSQTDVNVMPYEMVDYVNDYTNMRALFRYGGTPELLKSLIASGFPVIAEKGIYQTLPPEQTMQWAGHYAFTTGYDDTTGEFIWQDAYTPDEKIPRETQGKNVRMSYKEYMEGWRAFNYVFIVVYAPEREVELYQLLGQWADEGWAANNALSIALQEGDTLTGIDKYFAWFNRGTSYGLLTEYGQAALAYDTAFTQYNALPLEDRPYRIMWYQTGPYRAYYYTSRYQDVINLADSNESTLYMHRVLEETLYWRAMAEAALGYYDDAYADLRKAVYYNPHFYPGIDLMAQWGISP
jgi:tetratricopeptide (TPR) repeat protein